MDKQILSLCILLTGFCALVNSQTQPVCTSNGFFRNPEDCTRFYRCVDLTGNGYFQVYTFSCPVGTIFDESIQTCNHIWSAPPCDITGGAGEEAGAGEGDGVGEETGAGEGVGAGEETDAGEGDGVGEETGAAEGVGAVDGEVESEETDTVIVNPVFSYQCTSIGFFAHESDCSRFWLCNQVGNEWNPELYQCPDGYLYEDQVRTCLKEEEVYCTKTPDYERIALEPRPYKLSEIEMRAFFFRYRFFRR